MKIEFTKKSLFQFISQIKPHYSKKLIKDVTNDLFTSQVTNYNNLILIINMWEPELSTKEQMLEYITRKFKKYENTIFELMKFQKIIDLGIDATNEEIEDLYNILREYNNKKIIYHKE